MTWGILGLLWLIPQISFSTVIFRTESVSLDLIAWAGYVILGIVSLVLTALLLRDLALGLGRIGFGLHRTLRRNPKTPESQVPVFSPERRAFLLRSTNLAIVTGAGLGAAIGYNEARHGAELRRVYIPIDSLPPDLEGLTIAQFSDLHIGPTIKRPWAEQVVAQLLPLSADVIVFTGDLVDGSVRWLRDDVAPLRQLSAPLGTYFITGNHEYYSGAEEWVEEADRLGFTVLLNEHRLLTYRGSRLVLAGVTDYTGGQFLPSHRSDPAAAAAGAPGGLVKVLLAHQPVSAHAALNAGFDLQLSGHTHGGQFFPWNYLAYLNQPFLKGLHQLGSMWVYVNSGIGYWGPPLRLGAPPEITLITLTRPGPSAGDPGPER
jgi:predicted MPP superfamily phosphohydrolase